jgi:hypothetical protein
VSTEEAIRMECDRLARGVAEAASQWKKAKLAMEEFDASDPDQRFDSVFGILLEREYKLEEAINAYEDSVKKAQALDTA